MVAGFVVGAWVALRGARLGDGPSILAGFALAAACSFVAWVWVLS